MRKNYEIKIPVKDFEGIRKAVRKFLKNKTHKHYIESQKDIYYNINSGRLKLRIINDEIGNLIYYNRKEHNKKRVSNYIISATKNFNELDEILRKFFDIFIIVDKRREIFTYENVRIHLDKVKKLGSYLEIEVIYDSLKDAKKIMNDLINYFNLNENDFIKDSYSDLSLLKFKK
ncbi:class IV adenylate cyclase [Bacteroidota bacterium]